MIKPWNYKLLNLLKFYKLKVRCPKFKRWTIIDFFFIPSWRAHPKIGLQQFLIIFFCFLWEGFVKFLKKSIMWFATIKKSQELLIIIPIWKRIKFSIKIETRKMLKTKLFSKSYKFCIKNFRKMGVFPKMHNSPSGVDDFYSLNLQKNLLQNVREKNLAGICNFCH